MPTPLFAGLRKLPRQCVRQVDLPVAPAQVLLMERLHFGEMILKERGNTHGEGGDSVLVAFARSHGDLFHSEVNVLDPEAHDLHDSQAAAVKQLGH